MLSYVDLKTKVGELVQRSDDSDYLTKIGTWINFAYIFIVDAYDFWTELHETHDFTSTASLETYNMPTDFDKPLRIYDITNDKKLNIITEEKYFDANIANMADLNEDVPDYARLSETSGTGTSVVKVLKLGLIPDDAYDYRVLYKKRVSFMSADTDAPFVDCDRYLIMDAWGWALKQEKQDQLAIVAWQKASEALQILLSNQASKLGPDYQHKIESTWSTAHRI